MSQYLDYLGISGTGKVNHQLCEAELIEAALKNQEGHLSDAGALVVNTGIYTGRSPNDRFFVDTELIHDKINLGKVNVPISEEKFNLIYEKVKNYLKEKELYVFDGYACADKEI